MNNRELMKSLEDDLFGLNTLLFGLPLMKSFNEDDEIRKVGFKNLIKRPHNLKEIKDTDGNVIAQVIEVTTTPFKKEDVSVMVEDDKLIVNCGTENLKDAEDELVIYRGISQQTYRFSLKIPDTIDKKRICATNKDGILTITMPISTTDKLSEKFTIEIK